MTALHTLLVCTVGGTHEPIAYAIKGCEAESIIFIASAQSKSSIQSAILPLVKDEELADNPEKRRILLVPDAQDFTACVETIRSLTAVVEEWTGRGDDFKVMVDFTGGTKCMSAALALVARRWRCHFSYVGGTERSKNGTGVVVSGTEKALYSSNPWDGLGYQCVEEATTLFDKSDYQAAVHVLESGLAKVEREELKQQLRAMQMLAEAYLSWDLFDHKRAAHLMGQLLKSPKHVAAAVPAGADIVATMKKHVSFLTQFQSKTPGQYVLLDLLANARRCAVRGRYDDAVARLYRTIEAASQLRLHAQYGAFGAAPDGALDFGKLKIDCVPETLRTKWAARARNGIMTTSGLGENYELLVSLGDTLGKQYSDGEKSVKRHLTSRNNSILAHGFMAVSQSAFDGLWRDALYLTEIREEALPEFPTLGPSPHGNSKNRAR